MQLIHGINNKYNYYKIQMDSDEILETFTYNVCTRKYKKYVN